MTIVWPAQARPRKIAAPEPATCEQALTSAENANKLPPLLLKTIALVESGRIGAGGALTPWAWTIDADGVAHQYGNKTDAVAAAKGFLAAGVKSLDVGCMQVNLQSHPDAFDTLDTAFDPAANTSYAARFLKDLYRRTLSWPQAAMAYHSQTPAIGKIYQEKVMALWPAAALYRPAVVAANDTPASAQASQPPVDPNATPLLTAWLRQNADDVARLAADHQLIRD